MKRNAIVIFKGKPITRFSNPNDPNDCVIQAEALEIIPEDFEGDVVVFGNLIGSSIEVKGNLWIIGKVSACDLRVDGSLYCYDRIEARDITVKEDFVIYNTLSSSEHFIPGVYPSVDTKNLYVGGNIDCDGYMDVSDVFAMGDVHVDTIAGYHVSAGGDFTCDGLCTADVKACGFFECKGEFTGKIVS